MVIFFVLGFDVDGDDKLVVENLIRLTLVYFLLYISNDVFV